MKRSIRRLLLALTISLSIPQSPLVAGHRPLRAAAASVTVDKSFPKAKTVVPMKADRWLSNGNATFMTGDEAPDGVLEISKGSVDVKDLIFEDGTIEFDMYMPDHGILGMTLRAQNRENAEALYFRPQRLHHVFRLPAVHAP